MDIEQYKICIDAISEIDEAKKRAERHNSPSPYARIINPSDIPLFGCLSEERRARVVAYFNELLEEERSEWEEKLTNL